MKAALLKIAAAILQIAYAPFKLLRTRKKITFLSRQSDSVPQDMQLLRDRIAETRPDIETVVLAKKIKKSAGGLLGYCLHMFSQMYHIATSKAVVTDGYCIGVSLLKHKKGTTFIQIWHALCAVKKFGFQSLDKPSGSSSELAKAMKMHRNYDFFIAASEATAEHFSQGFGTGIGKAKLLGLPRIDVLLKKDEEKDRLIREKYGIPPEKEIILYAPTFRKGKDLPLAELIASFDMENAVLVIKPHPLDETPIPKHGDSVVFDGEFGTYDWARASDRIITDYSAFGLEAALLEKPTYFFVYDLAEYEQDPGLNVDIRREMGKYAQSDAEGLFAVMKEEYDFAALTAFRNKYITVDTDDCTGKLADFITGFAGEDAR